VALLTFATSRLYDCFRREHVLEGMVPTEPAFDPAMHSLQALGGYPSTTIGTEPELRLLRETVPRIPLGEQILLELCFEEDPLSGPALARVLGVETRTLPSRLESAWKHLDLKQALEKRNSWNSPEGPVVEGFASATQPHPQPIQVKAK
jgi:hypothetical protein